jgi:hypothetical protein
MGPEDSYLLQYTNNVEAFWAEGGALALGAVFTPPGQAMKQMLSQVSIKFRPGIAKLVTFDGKVCDMRTPVDDFNLKM